MLVASLGALVVFFSVLAYVGSVSAQVGDLRSVVHLTKPVKAYEPITPEALEVTQMPKKWVPDAALGDPSEVIGLVAASDLAAGALVQHGMFIDRPGIRQGFREVAVLVDAETGVAGKIRSGDRVDIIVTTEQKSGTSSLQQASVLVENALVIQVGLPKEVADDKRRGGLARSQQMPVTFALPLRDALKLSYGESFAVKLRLALRGGGDESAVPPDSRQFAATAAGAAPGQSNRVKPRRAAGGSR
jgi:pilus assembly protein CpaB